MAIENLLQLTNESNLIEFTESAFILVTQQNPKTPYRQLPLLYEAFGEFNVLVYCFVCV